MKAQVPVVLEPADDDAGGDLDLPREVLDRAGAEVGCQQALVRIGGIR